MKQIILFGEGKCIGRINFPSQNHMVLVDLDDFYGIFWVVVPETINIDLLNRFIKERKTVEIQLTLDTAPNNDYTMTIKNGKILISDLSGAVIFISTYDDSDIDDDSYLLDCGCKSSM